MIKATFAGNPGTKVHATYSPTHMSENVEEFDHFYKDLRNVIESTPRHNFLVILGDLNAKVSSAHVKYSYNKRTNRNENILLELTSEKALSIVNTSHFKRENGSSGLRKDQRVKGM